MKNETYKAARERLLKELSAMGWGTKPNLKVPQAIGPGGIHLYFKAQAVYRDQHSLWVDIRGMSVGTLIAAAECVNACRTCGFTAKEHRESVLPECKDCCNPSDNG